MRLRGKTAVITGGASGQGAAEARLFIQEGARVLIADLNDADGIRLADELGENATFVHFDVASESAWIDVIDDANRRYGGLDILINNAGICVPGTLEATSAADMTRHFEVNVLGTFLGIKYGSQAMIAHGNGSIINVSSTAGLRAAPGLFAYAASKWSIRGLSKCAALELAPHNVRVNTIVPGFIDTPMLAVNDPALLEQWAAMVPMGRIGKPDDIAEAAAYLASDAAAYVTGTEFLIDGGFNA